MDMSKLPRMSQSPAPPPEATPASPAAESSATPVQYASPDNQLADGVGAEVWISAALGVIFLLVGRTFAAYCIAKLTGQAFHTNVVWQAGAKAGQEVEYPELEG